MLKAEEQMELAVLKKHGASIRGLSRSTGRSRNTVRRYLRGGDAVAKRKPAPKRAEKLDPFKAYIVGRMKAALPDRIPATVLFREIKERGYEGGETRVKLFVRGLTPLPAAAPAVRFETMPGHQMQADWATVGRGADKLSLFIATLGWSRQAYVEFCDDERVETLIGCHETAFLTFWGRAGRGPLRQHENCRYRAEHLWAWRASLPCGVPRLCTACRIPAATVSAVSRADEGQGRTLHRLSEAQLLGSVCCVDATGWPET